MKNKSKKKNLSGYEFISALLVTLVGQLLIWGVLIFCFYINAFMLLRVVSYFYLFLIVLILIYKNKIIESYRMNKKVFNITSFIMWLLWSVCLTFVMIVCFAFLPCHGSYCEVNFLFIPLVCRFLIIYEFIILILEIIISSCNKIFRKK